MVIRPHDVTDVGVIQSVSVRVAEHGVDTEVSEEQQVLAWDDAAQLVEHAHMITRGHFGGVLSHGGREGLDVTPLASEQLLVGGRPMRPTSSVTLAGSSRSRRSMTASQRFH